MFGKRSDTPQSGSQPNKPAAPPSAPAETAKAPEAAPASAPQSKPEGTVAPAPAETPPPAPKPKPSAEQQQASAAQVAAASNPRMERARKRIWTDLRDGIDLKSLARMDAEAARAEILSAVQEIGQFRGLDVTPAELAQIAKEAADDMLGFGPLEELLAQDGIADIMINGPKTVYVEFKG
ncbi:MAG: CpaF family protein, partial [Alphaproteobacteria bacterium]|nr:CpaF family protein [Alphaproteobacteria bacterium]